MINEINLEGIIGMLKLVPNTKEYSTPSIEFARGKYMYKSSFFQKIKNKLWQRLK